jgi:hypothetical protein
MPLVFGKENMDYTPVPTNTGLVFLLDRKEDE